ncbi:hypothetical protein [Enterobacter cloacae]|uniref:hypothetical protein n=1 Tax=Enterobacter cloacae TaxID=550 RepID=UPI003204636E
MSNIDKRAFAMTKELATLMVERFSMSPVSCKLLNEAWKKELSDEVAIAERMLALLDELEAKDKRIAEQREIMRQAASDISYAIFSLTGSDLSRLQPGVIETTDPTDTALIAERSLRAAADGKGEAL